MKYLDLILKVVAVASFILGINTLYDTGEPRPIQLSILNGMGMSFVLNLGLWLVSYDGIRKRFKYIMVVWMLFSLLGVSFVMSDYGWFSSALALMFHIWIIILLVRNKHEVANNA